MEKSTGDERNPLCDELYRALELTMQLEAHLDHQPHCKSLAQTILTCVQKSILLANSSINEKQGRLAPNASTDSTHSTGSESSQRAFNDAELGGMTKKRKTHEKRSSRVRVIPGPGGVEFPSDDGYTWRKYGQKDILGAKHPRGYYRCTHRNSQGCTATKQVQRSDEDPYVFDVTYHGTHTCFQMHKKIHKPQPQQEQNVQPHLHPQQVQQPSVGFEAGLFVKSEGLDSAQDQASPSFSFPSTPVSCMQPGSIMFSSPATPTTSESNCLMVPPCPVSNYTGGLNLHASESDLTELIPPATSATNSPMVNMDFMRETEDFDLGFAFGSYDFLSQGF